MTFSLFGFFSDSGIHRVILPTSVDLQIGFRQTS